MDTSIKSVYKTSFSCPTFHARAYYDLSEDERLETLSEDQISCVILSKAVRTLWSEMIAFLIFKALSKPACKRVKGSGSKGLPTSCARFVVNDYDLVLTSLCQLHCQFRFLVVLDSISFRKNLSFRKNQFSLFFYWSFE